MSKKLQFNTDPSKRVFAIWGFINTNLITTVLGEPEALDMVKQVGFKPQLKILADIKEFFRDPSSVSRVAILFTEDDVDITSVILTDHPTTMDKLKELVEESVNKIRANRKKE